MESRNKISSNKIIASILMIMALFGFFVVFWRIAFYVFEYDPEYSKVDYGAWNILSYFTVQSNIMAYIYFFFASLSMFGIKKAEKIGFNKTFGALVTVYVLVAGIVYCAGIPMGMTPPFEWDTARHSMLSFIQVYYHMIMPPVTLLLWFFPFSNEKIKYKNAFAAMIYPLVYSIFSVVRGGLFKPTYYPYPFYNPQFLWEMVSKTEPINYAVSYLMMLGLLVVGLLIFAAIAAIIILIRNKRVKPVD